VAGVAGFERTMYVYYGFQKKILSHLAEQSLKWVCTVLTAFSLSYRSVCKITQHATVYQMQITSLWKT